LHEAPTITTQASTSGINAGSSVTDTAMLSGNNGPVTGSVRFFVCGPAAEVPDCASGGQQVGEPKEIDGGSATSESFSPTHPGLYCFRVDYAPDAAAEYLAASHTNLTTECFTLLTPRDESPAASPPTISTQVSTAGINPGWSLTDTATLSGDNGPVTGSVTFFACGPAAEAPDCSSGGSQVGATKPVSGGTATSDPFSPTHPGLYCFRVEYTPATSAYGAGSHTNLTTECFTVVPLPTPPGEGQHVTVHKECPGGKAAETDRFAITNLVHPTGIVLDCGESADLEVAAGVPYSIDEVGAGNTSLAAYVKTLSSGCSGSLETGRSADCVITNTAAPSTIEVVKSLVPTSDGGKFNLQLDGATKAPNVGNGGTTGPVTVAAGNHTVGETAGTATSLGDYAASIDCKVGGSSIVKGSGSGPLTVHVSAGTNVVCTITNTRTTTPPPPPPPPPPTRTGTIEVVKSVAPGSDAGRFDLQIDGVTKAGGVGNGGSTGKVTVNTGAHSVGEVAAAGTNLGEYTSSVQCKQDTTVLASGSGTGLSVTVIPNASVVCTITNVRKAVDIQITKRASAPSVHVGDRITYTLVVTNNGPGTATGVTVSDPLPAEVEFVSVSSTQGPCTGGRVISCDLGTITPGGSVTITIVGTAATSARPATNRAVTVAREPESNTSNNSATAVIDILGVIRPPTPTCYTTAVVKPHDLKVGKRATIVVRVRERAKAVAGTKVRVHGAGIDKTGVTDRYGIARITVTPPTNGIIRITVPSHKTCARPQIGVIGVITPPVAG
jgi:uncharacterized repeat protein (TIGR01451 family)